VDLRFSIASPTMEDRLLQMVQALPGDVVVSTSLAAGCAPTRCTVAEIQTDALQWVTRVPGSGWNDETSAHVRLHTVNGAFLGPPFAVRDTPGSGQFNGFMSAGEYLLQAEVGCGPGPVGGTCAGNFSFSLELGDLIGP
jgi:hypothetical protein